MSEQLSAADRLASLQRLGSICRIADADDRRSCRERWPNAIVLWCSGCCVAWLLPEVSRLQQERDAARAQWRCFRCGMLLETDDEARRHFGAEQGDTPECIQTQQQYHGHVLRFSEELQQTREALGTLRADRDELFRTAYELLDDAEAQLAQVSAQRDALVDAVQKFLAKWALVLSEIRNTAVLAYVHGARYDGPTIDAEIDALQALAGGRAQERER